MAQDKTIFIPSNLGNKLLSSVNKEFIGSNKEVYLNNFVKIVRNGVRYKLIGVETALKDILSKEPIFTRKIVADMNK